MIRFIDNDRAERDQAAGYGRWQVIFQCASPDKTRQLDYCREQPPMVFNHDEWVSGDELRGRHMTRTEVADWAKATAAKHPQLNGANIDWF